MNNIITVVISTTTYQLVFLITAFLNRIRDEGEQNILNDPGRFKIFIMPLLILIFSHLPPLFYSKENCEELAMCLF